MTEEQPPTGPWAAPSGDAGPTGSDLPPTTPDPVVEPATESYTDTGPAKRKSGAGKKIVAAVAAVAVLGGGAFAVANMGAGSSGGADSPDEAVMQLLDAAANEDVLGALEILVPGERKLMKQPIIDIVAELQRLEVLSDEDILSGLPGVDLVFEDVETDSEEVGDGVAMVELINGTVAISGQQEELPIGDLILDQLGADAPEGEIEEEEDEVAGARIAAIEEDGGWYVSLFYTAAEAAREDADLPVPDFGAGIAADGAETPEAAVEEMLDALTTLDVRRMIELLPPDEWRVLHDYAPLFIDDAEDAVDDLDFDVSFDDLELESDGSGDRRSVSVTAFTLTADIEGDEIEMTYADGCTTVVIADEEQEVCAEDTAEQLESMGLSSLGDLFSGELGDTGIVVVQEDGGWYVEPAGTVTDAVVSFLQAIDREKIETFIEDIDDFSTELGDAVLGFSDDSDFEFGGDITEDSAVPETVPGDTEFSGSASTFPDDTAFTEDTGSDEADPLIDCYSTEDFEQCLLDAVANGEISEDMLPLEVRYPECMRGYYESLYEMTDQEFIDNAFAVGSCLQPYIDSGELDAYSLPPEIAAVQCVTVNPYAENAPDGAFEDLYECYFDSVGE